MISGTIGTKSKMELGQLISKGFAISLQEVSTICARLDNEDLLPCLCPCIIRFFDLALTKLFIAKCFRQLDIVQDVLWRLQRAGLSFSRYCLFEVFRKVAFDSKVLETFEMRMVWFQE